MKEFSIYPTYQLLEKENDEYFYVEDVDDISDGLDVDSIIKNLENELSSQPEGIVTNEKFDPLFSVIKGFADLSKSKQEKIIRLLCRCIDSLIESCTENLRDVKSSIVGEDKQKIEVEQYGLFRNALKMYVFLLYHYSKTFDLNRSDRKRDLKSEKRWKGILLKTFHSLLQWSPKNLERLWPTNKPEDEYFLLFFNLCNSFLGDAYLTKDSVYCGSIFDILKLFFNEREQSEGEIEEIVKGIVNKNHVGKLIIDYIETIKPDENFLNQLLLEIGHFDTKSLEKDSIKNFSRMLLNLSRTIPEQVVKNMSVIVGHLQDKWYQIRNGVIESLSVLISSYFKKNTSKKKVRDRFLDIFEERLKDVNAYTRNKTIQCLTDLYVRSALPNSYRLHIFPLIISRIRDKSSIVRKSAMSFVTSAINHNPYGGVLKLSKYELDLVEARKKLRDYEVENRIKHKEEKDLGGEDSDDEEDDEVENKGDGTGDGSSEVGESSLNTMYLKLQKIYRYYGDATQFIMCLHRSLDEVGILLNSPVVSDLKESIKLIVCCHDYQVEDSLKHVGRMLPLVWTNDIVDHVVGAFKEIFLKKKMVNAEVCLETAEYLIQFLSQAKIVEIQAVTTIVTELIHDKYIRTPLILAFWEKYIPRNLETKRRNVGIQIAAAIFLEMVAQAKPKAIVQRFSQIVDGILVPGCPVFLAVHTCRILYHVRKLKGLPTEEDTEFLKGGLDIDFESSDSEDESEEEEEEEGGRGKGKKKRGKDKRFDRPLKSGKDYLVLPSDHVLFDRLIRFLTERDFPISPWCSYAKELVKVIFSLSFHPKAIMNFVFDVLREKVEVIEITKVIFLLGEGCMRELELVISEFREDKGKLKKESKKRLKEAKKGNGRVEEVKRSNEKLMNDLEDTYYQKEQEIIKSDSIYLLYYNFILDIVADKNKKFGDSLFRKVALHALGRYMVVNQLVCQKNLVVIFELVLREKDSGVIKKLKSPKIRKPEDEEEEEEQQQQQLQQQQEEKEEEKKEEEENEDQKKEKMIDEDESEEEGEEEEKKKKKKSKEEEEKGKKQKQPEKMVDEDEEEEEEKEKKGPEEQEQEQQEEENKPTSQVNAEEDDDDDDDEYETILLCLSTEIRCNLILQIGDLFYRWTSELTKWRDEFYQLLSSPEASVRHNTLIILSNLILNDMIKTSSQMGQIAKLIVDPEKVIGLRSKAFFRELAKKKEAKTNPVYNLLPDIFSHLSVSKGLKRNEFEEIMSHLFQYIRLETQRIQLVKRFCERFKRTTDETIWKYLSFCLSELRIQKEKIFRVMMTSFKNYKNALSCDEVADDMLKISTIVKKNTKDEVFKNEVLEWEEKVKKTHRKLSGKNEDEEEEKEEKKKKEEEGQQDKMEDEGVVKPSQLQQQQQQQQQKEGEGEEEDQQQQKKKQKQKMVDEDEEEEVEGEEVSDSDFEIVENEKEKKKKEEEKGKGKEKMVDEDEDPVISSSGGEESEDDIVLDEEEEDDDDNNNKSKKKGKKKKKMIDEDEDEDISSSDQSSSESESSEDEDDDEEEEEEDQEDGGDNKKMEDE